jgi:hypothetical protein
MFRGLSSHFPMMIQFHPLFPLLRRRGTGFTVNEPGTFIPLYMNTFHFNSYPQKHPPTTKFLNYLDYLDYLDYLYPLPTMSSPERQVKPEGEYSATILKTHNSNPT